MTPLAQHIPEGGALIVYDGECPFCSQYVRMVRLKETLGPVQLVDARSDHPVVPTLQAEGYDLDVGMVLLWEGRVYYGDDCIHRLALLSSESGWLNRINAAIFKSETASRLLYPILKSGRRTVLNLLGRSRISDGQDRQT